MSEPRCHRCGLLAEDFAGLSPSGYHNPEDCLWLVMQENKRLRAEVERQRDFPGVIPHVRTPPTTEVAQMVIRHDTGSHRLIIDVTYVDGATAEMQYRGWRRARESGELAQLIEKAALV